MRPTQRGVARRVLKTLLAAFALLGAPAASPAVHDACPLSSSPEELLLAPLEQTPWNLGPAADPEPTQSPASKRCVPVPDRVEVRDIVEEFSGPQRDIFSEALRRSGRYLPMIRSALVDEGLPEEVGYLALVESHFRLDARSCSGALGMWQFMEPTAREYGLRIDNWVDERLDPEASTKAAARHLRDLYARFGDWSLSAAAYNAGAGEVGRALERHGVESFWDLCSLGGLSGQATRYVAKFLATLTIASDPAAYGFELGETEAPAAYDTVWLDAPVTLAHVARVSGAPHAVLRELNPALLRDRTPPEDGSFPLRVPLGLGPWVAEELQHLEPENAPDPARHRVRPGETLSTIAGRYGVGPQDIARLNGLGRRSALQPGQDLWLPPAGLKPSASKPDTRPSGVHVVQRGETVWAISRQYGVTPADLLRWNKRRSSVLRPGERLWVSAGDRSGPS